MHAALHSWDRLAPTAWDISANWVGGLPTASGTAVLNNGSTILVPAGASSGTYGVFYLGYTPFGSGDLQISGTLLGGNTYLADPAGSSATVTMSSGIWANSGPFIVGGQGSATIAIDGGQISGGNAILGDGTTGYGSMTMHGSAVWTPSSLIVGNSGTGVLLLDANYISTSSSQIGSGTGSRGNVTVSSGSFFSGTLDIGRAGSGTLLIEGGYVSSAAVRIGANFSGSGSATMNSGTWVANSLQIGGDGPGSLSFNGGSLTSGSTAIAATVGGTGSATVTGGSWTTAFFAVGEWGDGTLLISGGTLNTLNAYVGNNVLGRGNATVSGGTWKNNGTLAVGNSGTGRLTITNGGLVETPIVHIGASGTGSLLIDGGILTGTDAIIGHNSGILAGGRGDAAITSGTWNSTGEFTVGYSGTGSLLVGNGALVSTKLSYLGREERGYGSATVSSGGVWTNSFMSIGASGTGQLLIDGGLVSGSSNFIGQSSGGSGLVTITSGTWQNSSYISVGSAGTGELRLQGGLITSTFGYLGEQAGGRGTVIVTGGTWNNTGSFVIGASGTGGFLLNGGFVAADEVSLGGSAGGVGSLTLTSGTLITGRIVEGSGTGTLRFNGGILRARQDNDFFILGFEPGDVTIASGGAFIDSNGFTIGTAVSLSGSGALTKLGGGTLNVTGGNSYTGGTVVRDGTLNVTGTIAHGSANFTVGDTTGGNVTLQLSGLISSRSGFLADAVSNSASAAVSGTWNNSQTLYVGGSGTGTLTVNTGGLVSSTDAYVGAAAGSSGSVFVSGGAWNSQNLYLGYDGTGLLSLTGGLVTVGGTTTIATGTNGTFVLNSGTFSTARVVEGVGSGTMFFNGGVLEARANENDFLSGFEAGNLIINPAGFSIDSHGYNIGIASPFTGAGGLTKLGAGTLTFSGSNSYQGGTVIEGGILAVVTGGVINSSGELYVGDEAGNGALLIQGGRVASGRAYIAYGFNAPTGSITVTNGGVWTSGALSLGYGGSGTLTLSGGSISTTSAAIADLSTDSSGQATVTSGTWTNSGNLLVGNTGTGRLLVDGGFVDVSGTTIVASQSLSSGLLTLDSGTLATRRVVKGAGSGTFAFDGGVLEARADESNFISGFASTKLRSGGGVIDSGSYAITIGTVFTGSGDLTKRGPGTLTLSGSNSHLGGTIVAGGTLAAANNHALGSGGARVENHATLSILTGVTVSDPIILAGGTLAQSFAANTSLASLHASSDLSGGADTSARIVSGTTAQIADVVLSFSTDSTATNDGARQSDVLHLSGLPPANGASGPTDLFVLELSMTSLAPGSYLAWLNGSNEWVNAALGNTGNNADADQQGFAGTFAEFQATPGNGTDLSTYIGAWGFTDTAVWAVLNHNSDFSIVPEPSVALLLLVGTSAFLRRRRTQRS